MLDGTQEIIWYQEEERNKKEWVKEKMLKKMKEKTRWKCIQDTEGKKMYRQLNNEFEVRQMKQE